MQRRFGAAQRRRHRRQRLAGLYASLSLTDRNQDLRPAQSLPSPSTLDIRDCFENIKAELIRSRLRELGFGDEVVDLLVRLTTHHGRLPTGAPSSPAIANLVLQHGEAEIVRECDPLGVRVTRYGDDYAISAASREGVVAIRNMIIRDLQALGLPLNRRKSSTMPNHRAQVVHGLTVNGRCASLPKRKRAAPGRLSREALRDEVRRACRDGATDEQQRRLEGQLAHLARRHPQQAEKLRRLLGQTRADHP